MLPHHVAEFAVQFDRRLLAADRQQLLEPPVGLRLAPLELGVVRRDHAGLHAREPVRDRVRQHEVPVGQALHQGARPEAVRPVVREVRLADDEQPVEVAHQLVVHPQPAHRVVDRGVDAHRLPIGVLGGDPLVHGEQVAVLLLDPVAALPADGVGEVEVDAAAARPDPAAVVARGEVAEARVLPLQVVVAGVLGDLVGVLAHVLAPPRHPHPAVVAERLAHERQLRLVVAGDRDARRVDLGEARVGERRPAPVRPVGGRDVAPDRVGGEEEDVAVAAGGEHDGVGGERLDLAGDQVAGDDPAGPAVDHDEVEHLAPREHLHGAVADLPAEGLEGAQQELLAGLAAAVEGALELGAAEGAGVEQAAVLAGERHPLGDALVDDVDRRLGEPVDVRLPAAEVAALDGVVEEAVDAVAVVAVVLGGVDPALGGDRVGAAGRVLEAERQDVVAQLGEAGGGAGPGEPGADDDDRVLPLVGRVDQPLLALEPGPLLGQRPARHLRVEIHIGASPRPRRGRR